MHTDGDAGNFVLIAASDAASLRFDAEAGTISRLPANLSSNSAIQSIGSYLSSTATYASDSKSVAPHRVGFGMDSVVGMWFPLDPFLSVPGLPWTVVVGIPQEAFETDLRTWASVAVVLSLPVLFLAVMLSTVVDPQKDLVQAATKRWGMARAVLLAAVGRPLPLRLQASIQRREERRAHRLYAKAIRALYTLRKSTKKAKKRFWGSAPSAAQLEGTQIAAPAVRPRRRSSASTEQTPRQKKPQPQQPQLQKAPIESPRSRMKHSHLPAAPGFAVFGSSGRPTQASGLSLNTPFSDDQRVVQDGTEAVPAVGVGVLKAPRRPSLPPASIDHGAVAGTVVEQGTVLADPEWEQTVSTDSMHLPFEKKRFSADESDSGEEDENIQLPTYEVPDAVSKLGHNHVSRKQVVSCYEHVTAFLEATVADPRAKLMPGPLPQSIQHLRPEDQRLVMAALAMSGVANSPMTDPVLIAQR